MGHSFGVFIVFDDMPSNIGSHFERKMSRTLKGLKVLDRDYKTDDKKQDDTCQA